MDVNYFWPKNKVLELPEGGAGPFDLLLSAPRQF